MESSMLTTTFTGNITFQELVTKDGQGNLLESPFLGIKVAVNDINDNSLTVEIRTKNGLLKAVQDGENLVGTRVTVAGSIDLASISSHWVNDEGGLIARKKPQFRVYANTIERHARKPIPATPVQPELVA
tara:strand:- start:1455 stop:1844 length:390 start_codon:yes stop_codon:yes gene_type:complete